ncbi:MAG TPA: hypothetical protein VD905_19605 [Flavobacteriales bacterium]|nr:hypothetical protein [Flavobacteriales bacterium]
MELTPKQGEGTTIALKPYSTQELADLYGISVHTFKKWIAPFKESLGKKIGWYWSIPQVKIIFQKLDLPSVIVIPNN